MPKDHVQIRDEESGELVWVTRETYEAREYWRQKMQYYINKDKVRRGTIVITSTSADDGDTDFKNLWTNNE